MNLKQNFQKENKERGANCHGWANFIFTLSLTFACEIEAIIYIFVAFRWFCLILNQNSNGTSWVAFNSHIEFNQKHKLHFIKWIDSFQWRILRNCIVFILLWNYEIMELWNYEINKLINNMTERIW